MAEVKFTQEHEWIRAYGDVYAVGISDYAQQQLGDMVYVELPEVGAKVEKGDEVAVVESVKAASEIFAPAAGTVIEVNKALTEEPAKINLDAMGEGWLFKLELSNVSELDPLMDEAAYEKFLETLE